MAGIIPETSQAKGDEVRQEQVAKKQKEYRMVGRQRRVPGLTLFEFDKNTHEIRPAQVKREAAITTGGKSVFRTRTDIHEHCFYLQALNVKNAEKKLKKI